MSRDQRVRDNWALIHAAFKAAQTGAPLVVIFCLLPTFQGAGWRHYAFMLQGLRELEESLAGMNIAFRVIPGDPVKGMTAAIEEYSAGLVVADFDPLRVKRRWRRTVAAGAKIRCEEVDAHNIAPCRHVSKKQEYAAHTLRPKINKLLPEFLHEYPDIEEPVGKSGPPAVDWAELYRTLE
ncbi:MAG: deoxyribodipyrimidine photo-lyase, partial [Desulfobacteraceae bacterium]